MAEVDELSTLADLKQDPENARAHNPRNIGMITNALHEVGAARSIVVDEDNMILAGNGVYEAAVEAGIQNVQVVEADGETIIAVKRSNLTDEQKRRLAYFDNRTAELADWNIEQIVADLENGVDLDGIFGEDELKEMLDGFADGLLGEDAPEPQIDKAEELREKWAVSVGDLWAIPSQKGDGVHKIICGDCTDAEVVERVMDGEKVEMVWTDPPYGVKYGDKLESANPMGYRVRTIENDDLVPDELEEFIRAAFTLAAQSSVPAGVIYAACPPGTPLPTAIAAFTESGFEFRWQLVWVKDQLVLSRADYHFRHENILYGWKPDGAHYFVDDRTQDSVFEIPRPKVSEEHPTMKPVELVEALVRNSSKSSDIVYDPFLGSGTTLVACERLGRLGRGIEISPAYTAVSLQRLADMNLQPERAGL